MHMDILVRGFSLSESLLAAVEERGEDFRASFPQLQPQIQVRLFDVDRATRTQLRRRYRVRRSALKLATEN